MDIAYLCTNSLVNVSLAEGIEGCFLKVYEQEKCKAVIKCTRLIACEEINVQNMGLVGIHILYVHPEQACRLLYFVTEAIHLNTAFTLRGNVCHKVQTLKMCLSLL